MSWLYTRVLRPLLFLQDSESIHNQALHAMAFASRSRRMCAAVSSLLSVPDLPVESFGLAFPNPIGLAAGMDKQAVAVPLWQAMGFGFCELGGVTLHPQPGNPQPRMFRAVPEEALINRMGFNNPGAREMASRLSAWRAAGRWPKHPVGINLGKSKITSLENARYDYASSFESLWTLGDFFVVNVSSPNTPNLRQLQDRSALEEILLELRQCNDRLAQSHAFQGVSRPKPILVKVSPDLSFDALDDIVELVGPTRLAGIVATNTTIDRPANASGLIPPVYSEPGGLSGRPLAKRSTEVIRHLHRQTGGRVPIIGVGGISTIEDAWEKVTAGACLLQLYSALVYEGPGIAGTLVRGLRERLAGASWQDVVGSANNAQRNG